MPKPLILFAALCLLSMPAFSQLPTEKEEIPLELRLYLEAPFQALIPDDYESRGLLRKLYGIKGDSVFSDGSLKEIHFYDREGRLIQQAHYKENSSANWDPVVIHLYKLLTWNYRGGSGTLRESFSEKVGTDEAGKVFGTRTTDYTRYDSKGRPLISVMFSGIGLGNMLCSDYQYNNQGALVTKVISRQDGLEDADTTALINYVYDPGGKWKYECNQGEVGEEKTKLIETLYRYDSRGRMVESQTCQAELNGRPVSIYNRRGKLRSSRSDGYRINPRFFRQMEGGWKAVNPDLIIDYSMRRYEGDHLMGIDGLSGPLKKCQYDHQGRLTTVIDFGASGSMISARRAIFKDGLILIYNYALTERDTNLPYIPDADFPGLNLTQLDSLTIDSSGSEIHLIRHCLKSGERPRERSSKSSGPSSASLIGSRIRIHQIEKWIVSSEGKLVFNERTHVTGADVRTWSDRYFYNDQGLLVQKRHITDPGPGRKWEKTETRKYFY